MYCNQCGGTVPGAARFCPSCGAAVGGDLAPGARKSNTWLIGIAAGVVVICLALLAVVVIKRNHGAEAQSSAGLPAPSAAGTEENALPPKQEDGYDWSGLSHEQLLAARAALDDAIAKEEKSRIQGAGAAPATDTH